MQLVVVDLDNRSFPTTTATTTTSASFHTAKGSSLAFDTLLRQEAFLSTPHHTATAQKASTGRFRVSFGHNWVGKVRPFIIRLSSASGLVPLVRESLEHGEICLFGQKARSEQEEEQNRICSVPTKLRHALDYIWPRSVRGLFRLC